MSQDTKKDLNPKKNLNTKIIDAFNEIFENNFTDINSIVDTFFNIENGTLKLKKNNNSVKIKEVVMQIKPKFLPKRYELSPNNATLLYTYLYNKYMDEQKEILLTYVDREFTDEGNGIIYDGKDDGNINLDQLKSKLFEENDGKLVLKNTDKNTDKNIKIFQIMQNVAKKFIPNIDKDENFENDRTMNLLTKYLRNIYETDKKNKITTTQEFSIFLVILFIFQVLGALTFLIFGAITTMKTYKYTSFSNDANSENNVTKVEQERPTLIWYYIITLGSLCLNFIFMLIRIYLTSSTTKGGRILLIILGVSTIFSLIACGYWIYYHYWIYLEAVKNNHSVSTFFKVLKWITIYLAFPFVLVVGILLIMVLFISSLLFSGNGSGSNNSSMWSFFYWNTVLNSTNNLALIDEKTKDEKNKDE